MAVCVCGLPTSSGNPPFKDSLRGLLEMLFHVSKICHASQWLSYGVLARALCLVLYVRRASISVGLNMQTAGKGLSMLCVVHLRIAMHVPHPAKLPGRMQTACQLARLQQDLSKNSMVPTSHVMSMVHSTAKLHAQATTQPHP